MSFNFRFYLIIFILAAATSSAFAGLDSLRMEQRGGKTFIIHEVAQGETLYGISRRYKASLGEVVAQNKIVDNKIDLGQILEIPTSASIPTKATVSPVAPTTQTHTVAAKETLYAISKKYGVTVDDIKKWNGLTSNTLSTGQQLTIGGNAPISNDSPKPVEPAPVEKPSVVEKPAPKAEEKPVPQEKKPTYKAGKDGFQAYYVQTGEEMDAIARKFNVRVDSIVVWNQLRNTYLSIGQKLLIRGELDSLAQTIEPKVEKTEYSTLTRKADPNGFYKISEEGIAKQIEDIQESEKYLALHRTLKIGTLVEVRNLMNNKKIFVRIVGKLPDTGLNENTVIRLSPICFKTLGIIDPLTRVELTYYED